MGATLTMESRRMLTSGPIRLLVPTAILLSVVAAAFIAATQTPGPLSADAATSTLTGGASVSLLPFAGLPLLLIGVNSTLEDTRHGLAPLLLVAQPRRSTLIAARLVALAAISAAVCVAQMPLAALAATVLGRPVSLTQLLVGFPPYLLSLVLLGWVGAALGWLTRNGALPVAIVLLDVLLLEPLIALATNTYSPGLSGFSRVLLFTSARDAAAADGVGLVITGTYALVLLGAAWLSVHRRDY